MATASPNDSRSTHHVILTDYTSTSAPLILCDARGNASQYSIRKDPLPRTSLKMYSGEPKWDDMEPPWTPIAMSEWSGGRGKLEYDSDKTRYWDARGIDTTKSGKLSLGPQPVYATSTSTPKNWPYYGADGVPLFYSTEGLMTTSARYAQSFTTVGGYDLKHIHLILGYLGSPGTLTVGIYANSAGSPSGSALGTATVTAAQFGENGSRHDWYFEFSSAITLSATTTYWIVLSSAATTDTNNYWIVVGTTTAYGTAKNSINGGTNWSATACYALFRTRTARSWRRKFLFEYKDQIYWIGNHSGGQYLYVMGDHGLATSGTTTTLTDSTKSTSWVADEFKGCIVRLVTGTGSSQRQNWAQITTNSTTVLTFSPAFDIAPAASTEYVIVASHKMTEITGHGVGAAVTDVLVANGYMYFCMGDGTNIRRGEFYDVTGTWTRRYEDEAAAGTFLIDGGDATGTYLMRCNRGTATIERANAVTTWTDLTWSGSIQVGSARKRITGLQLYENGDLWVLKEDSVWRIINGDAYWMPVTEMTNVADERNGRAHIMHQVYMFWSLHNTIVRYYDGNLDDIGIDRDDGLPANRKGSVVAFASYPGRLYAAVNGGPGDYSAVFCWNGLGWTEVYRGFAIGLEIDSICIQSIPGEHVDRLWISIGDDVLWIPLAENPFATTTVTTYNFYNFIWNGYIDTGYVYAGLKDVEKYWHSLKVFIENFSSLSGQSSVTALYRTYANPDTWYDWGNGSEAFNTQFSEIVEGVAATGVGLRINIWGASNSVVPQITAMVLDTAVRVPVKNSYSITFRVKENDRDLQGNLETVVDKLSVLQSMEDSSRPVTIASTSTLLNGKSCFFDSFVARPNYVTRDGSTYLEGYVCQAQLIEV